MRKCNSKQLNLNTFEALWSKILPPAYKTVVNFFLFTLYLLFSMKDLGIISLKKFLKNQTTCLCPSVHLFESFF